MAQWQLLVQLHERVLAVVLQNPGQELAVAGVAGVAGVAVVVAGVAVATPVAVAVTIVAAAAAAIASHFDVIAVVVQERLRCD